MNEIVASVIFFGSLALIFTEKLHRTTVALVGAGLMVGSGLLLEFYSEEEAFLAIDFTTLGLLFGMMVLVALLQPTGFFEYLAIQAGRLSKGEPAKLLVLLGTVTTILSMFLDNVTTVVLIAPITILICEILDLNPIPFLMGEALLSNTGGAGTLVGDPPNVLIGSAVPLSFNDFLTHALPVVIVTWVLALSLLLVLFRAELKSRPEMAERIRQLDPARALDDPVNARRVLLVLAGTVLLFFVHHLLHVSSAFIALAAASLALVWVRPDDMEEVLERVEWSVMVFFGALFVMVGGLEYAGVLHRAAEFVSGLADINLIVFGVGMIWIIAILSAIVDNVPITIALIPVIQGLGEAGINIQPLWWALVFGAGFGGNGTIIGSTANIVVVSISEKTQRPITAMLWSRRGLPVMILACFVSSILYAIFFTWFSR